MGKGTTVTGTPDIPSEAPMTGSNGTVASGDHRRAELAAFLRSRRERITPEQAGLPPGSRRRTPGLRREEVAQLSGVGVTWYTWLEQGRPINASPQVLTAVARTLMLDQAEREHLFRLADIPDAAAAASSATCDQVPPDVQHILDALVPLPASVLNERFDLLAWNNAYAVLWPGMVSAAPAERNTLWQCFTLPGCCHPYVNRNEQLSTLVAQLRGAYGRHLGEPAWTGFVRRLRAVSPAFSKLWDEQEVASQVTYLKVFRHPSHPRLLLTTTSLAVLSVPGTRVVVYHPVDQVTRDAIGGLLRGDGTGRHFPCWESHQRRRAELAAAQPPAAAPASPELTPV
jgi:transcriptional regulator with XRE-family HTH domain